MFTEYLSTSANPRQSHLTSISWSALLSLKNDGDSFPFSRAVLNLGLTWEEGTILLNLVQRWLECEEQPFIYTRIDMLEDTGYTYSMQRRILKALENKGYLQQGRTITKPSKRTLVVYANKLLTKYHMFIRGEHDNG